MNCRAKFYVSKVSEIGTGQGRSEITRLNAETKKYESTGIPHREITLSAVYDDGISKENKSFADATPSGSMTFFLSNPALADEFKPGDVYYLDFTKAS